MCFMTRLVSFLLGPICWQLEHSADLPDFMEKGCLKEGNVGIVEHYLWPNVDTKRQEDLLTINETELTPYSHNSMG